MVSELPSNSKALMALEICAALTDPVLLGSNAAKSLLASDVVPPRLVTKLLNCNSLTAPPLLLDDPLLLLDPLLLASMACIRSLATESDQGTPW